jgi:hypothetical protein
VAKKRKQSVFYGIWNSFLIFVCLTGLVIFFVWVIGSGTLDRNRYPMLYNDIVTKYCDAYGVDKYLVFSVIRTESFFDKDAVFKLKQEIVETEQEEMLKTIENEKEAAERNKQMTELQKKAKRYLREEKLGTWVTNDINYENAGLTYIIIENAKRSFSPEDIFYRKKRV